MLHMHDRWDKGGDKTKCIVEHGCIAEWDNHMAQWRQGGAPPLKGRERGGRGTIVTWIDPTCIDLDICGRTVRTLLH